MNVALFTAKDQALIRAAVATGLHFFSITYQVRVEDNLRGPVVMACAASRRGLYKPHEYHQYIFVISLDALEPLE